jgi:hypothetical protein
MNDVYQTTQNQFTVDNTEGYKPNQTTRNCKGHKLVFNYNTTNQHLIAQAIVDIMVESILKQSEHDS